MEDAVKRIQRAWRSRTAARLAAAALPDSTSTRSYLSTTGSRANGDALAAAAAAGRLNPSSPAVTGLPMSSQGGSSAGGLQEGFSNTDGSSLMTSSYTTDSYSYYSLAEASCSVSLQPSQGLVGVVGGSHSVEPSDTSMAEGGSPSSSTLQGRASFQDGFDSSCSGAGATAGNSTAEGGSASGVQQHTLAGVMHGRLDVGVRDSVAAAAGSDMLAPGRGVDLAASLATFKAAGHLANSLEPTPRLMSTAGR